MRDHMVWALVLVLCAAVVSAEEQSKPAADDLASLGFEEARPALVKRLAQLLEPAGWVVGDTAEGTIAPAGWAGGQGWQIHLKPKKPKPGSDPSARLTIMADGYSAAEPQDAKPRGPIARSLVTWRGRRVFLWRDRSLAFSPMEEYKVLEALAQTGPTYVNAEESLRFRDKFNIPTRTHFIWNLYRPVLLKFQSGELSRSQFLATCKRLLAEYADSPYDAQWKDLIAAMEHGRAAGPPPFLDKPAGQRTQQEQIAYRIWQLRDLGAQQLGDPGYPMLFAMPGQEPTAADRLVNIGPAAIPQLIKTLDDNTPTRTIAWQRSFYHEYFVLRRQDIALKCLERIVGFPFYSEGSTSMHFHLDTPERRASVIENIQKWWKRSEGKSQAEMVRNQLALLEQNKTLRVHDEIAMLETLAMLEKPKTVIERAKRLLAKDDYGLNSPIVELMEKIDRRTVVRKAMKRFWADRSKPGDYTIVLKYGDQRVYRKIARRFEDTGKLDPGSWNLGGQVYQASMYGQNWAIPIVAQVLKQTEMSGGRITSDGNRTQPCSPADNAIAIFTKLTDRDFGYERDANVQDRLAAIERAWEWWNKTGREQLEDKITADHAPVADLGDLLATDDQIARRVQIIERGPTRERAGLLAGMDTVYSWRVQRALVDRLKQNADGKERLQILRILQRQPALWMFPVLAETFRNRQASDQSRLLAGRIMEQVVADKSTSIWWRRLETRQAGLNAARRVLLTWDSPHSTTIQRQAAAVLTAWGDWDDRQLLQKINVPPKP
jgi:hypothetical protein